MLCIAVNLEIKATSLCSGGEDSSHVDSETARLRADGKRGILGERLLRCDVTSRLKSNVHKNFDAHVYVQPC